MEDLDAGYIAVLAEMIAGASSTPGLGSRGRGADRPVAAASPPTRCATSWPTRRCRAWSNPTCAAHAVVALYLGLEMLAHLDGDRAPALALFERARQLAGLLQMLGCADRSRQGGASDAHAAARRGRARPIAVPTSRPTDSTS